MNYLQKQLPTKFYQTISVTEDKRFSTIPI